MESKTTDTVYRKIKGPTGKYRKDNGSGISHKLTHSCLSFPSSALTQKSHSALGSKAGRKGCLQLKTFLESTQQHLFLFSVYTEFMTVHGSVHMQMHMCTHRFYFCTVSSEKQCKAKILALEIIKLICHFSHSYFKN